MSRDSRPARLSNCRYLITVVLEKAQPFNMGVACLSAGNQLARQLTEGGKQRNHATPDVVMRYRGRPLDASARFCRLWD